ncbi:MAG: hypothetical protein U1C73_08665, partial [Dietzia sp.]|nr:hypothetical protein [Dietzia sp.]
IMPAVFPLLDPSRWPMGRVGASDSAAGIAEGQRSNREINVNGHDWHPGKVRTPKASTVRRAAAIVWIVAGFGYLAAEAVAAARVSDYTYVADYVSNLGRPGSPLAWWMTPRSGSRGWRSSSPVRWPSRRFGPGGAVWRSRQ